MTTKPTAKPASSAVNPKVLEVMQLLDRADLVESLDLGNQATRQNLVAELSHRQQIGALFNKLKSLHPADCAQLLEMIPNDKKKLVWQQLEPQKASQTLVEMSESQRLWVVSHTNRESLNQILQALNVNDLSEVVKDLPENIVSNALINLDSDTRHWVEESLTYSEDQVGHLMIPDTLSLSENLSVEEAINHIRKYQSLPHQHDKIFVLNNWGQLIGILPLAELLVKNPQDTLGSICIQDIISFRGDYDAADAGLAFERYDLISAPVLDPSGRVQGRLTVEAVMDYLREKAEDQALAREGLNPNTDLFAPIRQSVKLRGLWLFINLITAVVASRFIGLFADTIEQLVALATLFPIVASLGGNTGNQTTALVVRAIATNQLTHSNTKYMFFNELGVASVNGVIWGSVLAAFAGMLYQNIGLGLVMLTATLFTLVIAAIFGAAIPLTLEKLGRDPAMGSSVLLTFVTDSMGFILFLGLATLLLV